MKKTEAKAKIWTPTGDKQEDMLKMACIEQAVKLGGNPEQALTAAKAFHAWITCSEVATSA